MDDLSATLQALLSDPETMRKLRGTLSQFGVTAPESSPAAPDPPAPEENAPDLSALLPLLQNLSADTDDTRLLHALRPFLHGRRAQRLEQADRMLRLRALLPVLQQNGLLREWMGGDG